MDQIALSLYISLMWDILYAAATCGIFLYFLCKSAPECTDVPPCAHGCAIFSCAYLMSKLSCKSYILNSGRVFNVSASSERVLADVHQPQRVPLAVFQFRLTHIC